VKKLSSGATGSRVAHPLILVLLLSIGMVWAHTGSAAETETPSPATLEVGKNIYRYGLLPTGDSVKAETKGAGSFTGDQLPCVSCHRRSGLGSSEGDVGVPPITGRHLFQPGITYRKGIYKTESTGTGTRQAYTTETLHRAIREGLDPQGRVLGPAMPRYQLTDSEIDALTAYLKTLSAEASPGVTDTEIHLATITTEGIDPEKSNAMIELIKVYLDDHNADIRNEVARGKQAPVMGATRKYKAFRKWRLHVWSLTGDPSTWGQQLQAYYQAQPVFVVVSGLAKGSWQPIHDFCEQKELPCLLPITDLPGKSAKDSLYTVYFSRGMRLEAEALANYLSQSQEQKDKSRVVQVFRSSDIAEKTASDAFRAAFQAQKKKVQDWDVDAHGKLDWDALTSQTKADVLVMWLRDEDLKNLESWLTKTNTKITKKVFLSSTLIAKRDRVVTKPLYDRVLLVHPFDLPAPSARKFIPTRNWLRSKDIEVHDMRVQASTYMALTIVNRAIAHLREDYSRDFVLERIEHMMDNILWTFIYPRFSLGPGQRFASKGAYIVKPVDNKRELEAVSEWIVP